MRVLLYLQYDAHVQQAVDEQLTVECDMRSREGKLVTLGNRMGVPLTSTSLLVGQGFSFSGEGADKEDNVDEDYEGNSIFEGDGDGEIRNDSGEWRGIEEQAELEEPVGEVVVGKRKDDEMILVEEKVEKVDDDAGELVFLERVVEEEVKEKEQVQENVQAIEKMESEVRLVGWLEVVHDNRVVKEVAPGDSVSLVARVGGDGAEHAVLGECREEGGRQLTPPCGQVGAIFKDIFFRNTDIIENDQVGSQWSGISGVRQLSALLEVPESQGRLVVVCTVLHCPGPCTSCRGGPGEIALRAEVQVARGPRAGHREAVRDQLQVKSLVLLSSLNTVPL